MFATLARDIEGLDIPIDGEAIGELLALRDRLDARISEALGEFDAAGLWELDGAVSLTSWLKIRGRMTSRDASVTARRAARLRQLPVTQEAWADGSLSGGQVAAVMAALRPNHEELFVEQEADVVGVVAGIDVRDTARVMNHWADMADALVEGPEPRRRERSLRASHTMDNRLVINGDLDADSGEVVLTALRMAEAPDADGEWRTPGERRADALVDLCRFFLGHQTDRPGGRHRPHVNVVVEADDLYEVRRAKYLNGIPLSPEVAASVLCDAVMHRTVVDPAGAILDYGRATRTISAPLWSALVVRDQGCRFPGCDREPRWCEAHHVVWFSEGGETSIWNLALLCSRHHHLLHDKGWKAKLLPDATFEVTHPSGFTLSSRAPRSLRLEPKLVPRE
jgi:hypothetical protein